MVNDEHRLLVVQSLNATNIQLHNLLQLVPSEGAISESNFSQRSELDPIRKPRFDWRQIPACDGSSITYPSWKERIQTILGLYDLSDKEKGGIVTIESCVKSEDLLTSLLNLSFSGEHKPWKFKEFPKLSPDDKHD